MNHFPSCKLSTGQRAKAVFPRVLEFLLPHKLLLSLGTLTLFIGAGINLFFPFFVGKVLNSELGFELKRDLNLIVGILLTLFFVQSLVFFARHYSFSIVGYRLVTAVRTRLYQALVDQDVSFFDRSRIGDLLSRLSLDAELLQRSLTTNVSVALRYLLQVVGGVMLMAFISAKLTGLLVVVILLAGLASVYWGKKLRRYSKRMQEELAESQVAAQECLGAIRMVKIFAGTEHEASRYSKLLGLVLCTSQKRTLIAALFSSSVVFLLHSSIAILLWFGASLVISSALSIGDLASFLIYATIVAVSFSFLASAWDDFMQAIGAGERIFEILDSKPEVKIHEKHMPVNLKVQCVVRFDSVCFSYPTRPEPQALSNISFEISRGERVAIVGPSGAGKSTIVSLICRYYDPCSGRLEIFGKQASEISYDEVRASISLVPQDPQIFSVSIAENIAYGRLGSSAEEIRSCARSANIAEFIESLPQGYDTLVGDRGVRLSGGQKQRVAIARAILKDPALLILDEATSALDSENERLVREALGRLMPERTSLIIAHRLSTVKNADKVLVLRGGGIVQQGSHDDLMKTDGLYRALASQQLLS